MSGRKPDYLSQKPFINGSEYLDGHDAEAIRRALTVDLPAQPFAVVARTIKGHGVSFMENRMEWHYLPMSAEQYAQAVEEAKRL